MANCEKHQHDVLASADGLLRTGAIGEATALLERELAHDSAPRVLADRLINIYVSSGNIGRALEIALADCNRHGADDARASTVVHLAQQTGDLDRALDLARHMVAADPRSASRQALLSSVAVHAKRLDVAEQAIRAAIAVEPSCLAHRRVLSFIVSRLERPDEQIEILKEAAILAPDDPGLRRELSAAYATHGRLEDAEREARKALALAPASADMRIHLSGLVAQHGNIEEAVELLREVVGLEPDRAIAHYSLSHLLWGRGEVDLAIVHASRASLLDPGEFGIRDHYLRLLEMRATLPPATQGSNSRIADTVVPFFTNDTPVSESTRHAVANWARVILAIMLREMGTRHAGTRMGFAWAVFEPLTHLAVLAAVFSIFNRGPPPLGHNWFFFYATGVIPFLMWSHVTSHGFHGLVGNATLLQIPAIKRLDVLLASALVELSISIAVGSVMFFVFWAVEAGPAPRDPLAIIQSVSTLWLFALGISVINATIETMSGTWSKFWPSVTRLNYFISGIFYVPFHMPEWLRDILVLNPLLQCLEWLRTGFFDQYNPPWLDRGYAVIATFSVLLFGLIFEAAMRRRALR